MPAITASFAGDATQFDAACAAAEKRAAMSAKRVSDQAASASAAYRQHIEGKILDAQPGGGTSANFRASMADDQAAWTAKYAAAKAASAEVKRLDAALAANVPGSANPRASMAADQAAWEARRHAARQQLAQFRLEYEQAERERWSNPATQQAAQQGSHQAGLQSGKAYANGWRMARPMLISALRDSAASMASGMPISTIIAQQAPQVGQALSMMGVQGVGFAFMAQLAAISAMIYGTYWTLFKGVQAVIEASTLQLKATLEYVPYLKRHITENERLQERITRSVRDTREAYASVEQTYKRINDQSRADFAQRRAALAQEKELALVRATSPAARLAVERTYGQRQLNLQQQENDNAAGLRAKEQQAYLADADAKQAQAKAILVNTAEEDAAESKLANERAAAARAYLEGASVFEEFKKQAVIEYGGMAPGKAKERENLFAQLEMEGRDLAQTIINKANAFSDKVAKNDTERARRKQLQDQALESRTAAEKMALGEGDLQARAKQEMDAAQAAEAQRLAIERAKMTAGAYDRGSLTSNQQVGAYAMPAVNLQTELQRQQLHAAQQTHTAVTEIRDIARRTSGQGVVFGSG